MVKEPVLTYDELATFLWEGLLALGYVPEHGEILDIADLTFSFVINLVQAMGVEILWMDYDEEDENGRQN